MTLTAENSCKCNVMVCAHCFDLSVVTDSINGNSIQCAIDSLLCFPFCSISRLSLFIDDLCHIITYLFFYKFVFLMFSWLSFCF